MVPGQRLGPSSQFLVGAASQHGAQTFFAHRQVVQQLQHIKEDGNWHGVQYQRLERVDHFDSTTEQNWNELDLGRVGVLPTRSENVIGGETSRGEYEDERKL